MMNDEMEKRRRKMRERKKMAFDYRLCTQFESPHHFTPLDTTEWAWLRL